MFELHPQLEKDCNVLGEFELCLLLLLDDANYPWFILVPQREGITEIHRLSTCDQQLLLQESVLLSHCLEQLFQPDKLNIAALGNIVPQLHVHHIARFKTDACWPAPVWGAVDAVPYERQTSSSIQKQIISWLTEHAAGRFRPD